MALGQISSMGGDLVCDHAVLHILFIRQAKVFFGRHVAKDGRVPGTGTDSGSHQSLEVRGSFLVGKEPDIPFHRHAYHDVQAVPLGGVEKPARRHGVSADCIQAVC